MLILREVKGVEIDSVLECAAGAAVGLDGERMAVGPGGGRVDPGTATRREHQAPGIDRRHVGLDLHSAELSLTEPERHVPIEAVARPRSGTRSASARADERLRSSS